MPDSDPRNVPTVDGATDPAALAALADLFHAWFLGLQLAVTVELGAERVGDWSFQLFRQQHLDKFLSSFEKLELRGLPDAVACARYHCLSNDLGGVPVQYFRASDRRAWVRFRYPRWLYAGPTICAIPVSVSRGFLKGWYAHNGVSLGNPNLGFVCVSEDMTGEFGLCGYFEEFDEPLSAERRLQFAPDAPLPDFDSEPQPAVAASTWSPLRLARARRNYAMEYVRNGLGALLAVAPKEAERLAQRASHLIGLQYYRSTTQALNIADDAVTEAAQFLRILLAAMGDGPTPGEVADDKTTASIQTSSTRITRDLSGEHRRLVEHSWAALWNGTMRSQSRLKSVHVAAIAGEASGPGRRYEIRLTTAGARLVEGAG